MKRWTLRLQITFFVGLIMTLACAALTINSIYSARRYYGWVDQLQITQMAEQLDPSSIVIPDYVPIQFFTIQGILMMLLIICCSVLFTYWATGRLLLPLTALTSSIREIGQHNLHQRVDISNATGEAIQLTNSFNGMLDRLENSFTIQKNFAANAAHELKTPLTTMKTSLQVLQMEDAPELADYEVFVLRMESSLERLIPTVEGLTALTNDFAQYDEKSFFIKDILEQAKQELSPMAEERQVKITICGESGLIHGNWDLLYRAFYNLMENAVKYNRPGGTVHIQLDHEKELNTVEIADTGQGISTEGLFHIFEPFYREDRSRSQKIPGSGLGLALVKLIIERHHGTIRVESEKERGTKVFVTLP